MNNIKLNRLSVKKFFLDKLSSTINFIEANQIMSLHSGITSFFEDQQEFEEQFLQITLPDKTLSEVNRTEYGDFQTNPDLALKVTRFLKGIKIIPGIVIEPTCGKGNFILALLQSYSTIKKIYAIEIYKVYLWETKYSILEYCLTLNTKPTTKIELIHSNIFDFDFSEIIEQHRNDNILLIGNPPWVTNSQLGTLNSENLPQKSNFKNFSGIDAITGKGNFDIGEFITMTLLKSFQYNQGNLALLIKNSVIKNLIYDQYVAKFRIGAFRKFSFDAKKEFNASVEASLLVCNFASLPEVACEDFSLDNPEKLLNKFGWFKDKFVSNIELYENSKEFDGKSPFEWRQGVKHDCSQIMEFEKENGHYVNNLKNEFKLESDLVFGLLKSSDLKEPIINQTRKFTIITQKKVGQKTDYIQSTYPLTYGYLHKNSKYFESRKSTIYSDKPPYSIFGIGDYSFKPYKVSISALYKKYAFNLVLPQDGKPLMLDDTCYFLGFDRIDFAFFTFILLNSNYSIDLLKAITFQDAKRIFTKDILMRIDLLKISQKIDFDYISNYIKDKFPNYENLVKINAWLDYLNILEPIVIDQLSIF